MSPVVCRKEQNDPDFLYLRNYRNRINDDIEKHSLYQFSLYKNAAMLTVAEPKSYQTIFPDQKASSDLILQISNVIHSQKDKYVPNEWGGILLTAGEFEQLIAELKGNYLEGWVKAYREGTISAISKDLLNMMETWLMAEVHPETGMIELKPLLGLLSGAYPKDFLKGDKEHE
jgi:uncharacterized protein (TIGR02678 family)